MTDQPQQSQDEVDRVVWPENPAIKVEQELEQAYEREQRGDEQKPADPVESPANPSEQPAAPADPAPAQSQQPAAPSA